MADYFMESHLQLTLHFLYTLSCPKALAHEGGGRTESEMKVRYPLLFCLPHREVHRSFDGDSSLSVIPSFLVYLGLCQVDKNYDSPADRSVVTLYELLRRPCSLQESSFFFLPPRCASFCIPGGQSFLVFLPTDFFHMFIVNLREGVLLRQGLPVATARPGWP